MEHNECVFTTLKEAQEALEEANAHFYDADQDNIDDKLPEAEILPTLPEDEDNPGSLPCDESNPKWQGEYCVFSKNCEWVVSNDSKRWCFVA